MWFLIKLAISLIISYISSELFAPSPPQRNGSEDANSLDQEEVPTATMGKTIPAVFGSRWLTSPNVVFWRKSQTVKVNTSYRKHYVDLHMVVCHAPVETIKHIGIDKKIPVLAAPVTLAELMTQPSLLHVTMSYLTDAGGIHEIVVARWGEPSRQFTGTMIGAQVVTDIYGNDTYLPGQPEVADIVTAGAQGYTMQTVPLHSGTQAEVAFADPTIPIPPTLDKYQTPNLASTLGLPEIAGGEDGVITFKVKTGASLLSSESISLKDVNKKAFGDSSWFGSSIITNSITALTYIGAKITHEGATQPNGDINPTFSVEAGVSFDAGPPSFSSGSDGGEDYVTYYKNILEFDFETMSVPLTAVASTTGILGKTPLDMPNLFGGYKEGGGISGTLFMVNGNQTSDPEVASAIDWLHTTSSTYGGELVDGVSSGDYALVAPCQYRGVVSAILQDTYVVANAGSIRPWHFGVKNRPTTLPGALGYAFIGENANAACIMYEVLTNKVWGKGLNPNEVEVDTFVRAAKRLHEEGLGTSLVWSSETSIDDFIGIVAKHAFGTWRVDVFRTGKVQFQLFREYQGNFNDLHTINPLNIEVFKRKSVQEVTNEIQLKWKEYTDVGDVGRITYARNMSHIIRNNGAINSTTMEMNGVADKASAQYLAQLNLDSDGYPLAVIDFTEDIMSGDYLVGDHILVDERKYVRKPTIFRVTDITTKESHKSVIAIEDVFAYTALEKDSTIISDKLGLLVTATDKVFSVNPFTNSDGSFFITSVTTVSGLSVSLVDAEIQVTASTSDVGVHWLAVAGFGNDGMPQTIGAELHIKDEAVHVFSLLPVTANVGSGNSLLLNFPTDVRGFRILKETPEVSIALSPPPSNSFHVVTEAVDNLAWNPPYDLQIICRDIFNSEAVLDVQVV